MSEETSMVIAGKNGEQLLNFYSDVIKDVEARWEQENGLLSNLFWDNDADQGRFIENLISMI